MNTGIKNFFKISSIWDFYTFWEILRSSLNRFLKKHQVTKRVRNDVGWVKMESKEELLEAFSPERRILLERLLNKSLAPNEKELFFERLLGENRLSPNVLELEMVLSLLLTISEHIAKEGVEETANRLRGMGFFRSNGESTVRWGVAKTMIARELQFVQEKIEARKKKLYNRFRRRAITAAAIIIAVVVILKLATN